MKSGKGMDSLILSVLIPTIPERSKELKSLKDALYASADSYLLNFEILIDDRARRNDGGPTIAAKRNSLYEKAKGLFSVQIDDDDSVDPLYIKTIVEAIIQNPDIDAIEHQIAVEPDKTLANISINNTEWNHNISGKYAYQQPFYYKLPIRTSICRECKMDESLIWGEDGDFSRKLIGKIKTVFRIEKALQTYNNPGQIDANQRY